MSLSPGGVEVGRVSLRVVPDTSHLGGDLKVALDRLEATSELTVGAKIDNANLDAQARSAVAQAQRAAGDITIKAKVDKSQVSEFGSALGTAAGKADSFVGKLGLLGTAVLALGPTLIPIIGTIGALGAALAAPLVIAGSGLTLFGVLTGFAIKDTEAQKKKIDALKKSVDAAKLSLSNTTASASASAAASLNTARFSASQSLASARAALATAKTATQRAAAHARINAALATLSVRQASIQATKSRSVAAAQLKVNDATDKYKAALGSLTPAQKKFLAAQDGLKQAFHKLIETAGPALLGPVTKVVNLLATLAPTIQPILTAVASVLDGIIGKFDGLAKSPSYKAFVDSFARQLGPDIKAFATIAGNVFVGLFGIFGVFNRTLSGGVLRSLERLTRKFADFGRTAGQSKGLKSFVDYVKRVTPQVITALGKVGRALGHIVSALAPIGPPVLRTVGGIASALSKIPVPVLTKLAEAMLAIVLVQKVGGFKALGLLSKGFSGARTAVTSALGATVGSKLGKGVVPVFVTNEGFGGGTRGGSKVGKVAGKVLGPVAGSASGFLAASGLSVAEFVAAALAGTVIGVASSAGYVKSHTNALLDGPFGFNTLMDHIGTGAFHIGPEAQKAQKAIRATTTKVDGLKQGLATASHKLDQIGPQAVQSFGLAQDAVEKYKRKLASIKVKKMTAVFDDVQAIQRIRELQAIINSPGTLRLTVNAGERQFGQFGGVGHHDAPVQPTPAPRPRSGSNEKSAGATVTNNTYNIQAQDYHDFLRQLQRRRRGRSGGGVLLGG